MKSKRTRKKFYNKWSYKISLKISGIGIFRIYDLNILEDRLDLSEHYSYYASKVQENKDVIIKLVNLLKSFPKDQWSKRIERSTIDLYTNDKSMYQSIHDQFTEIIIHCFEPDPGFEDSFGNKKTIIGKKLPHDRYRYRVYLLPHKMAGDIDGKNQYIKWMKSQIPQITFTEAVERWFRETSWNWDRRYILVEDEKTLLMLKLRKPEVVGSVYNYVVCDK